MDSDSNWSTFQDLISKCLEFGSTTLLFNVGKNAHTVQGIEKTDDCIVKLLYFSFLLPSQLLH